MKRRAVGRGRRHIADLKYEGQEGEPDCSELIQVDHGGLARAVARRVAVLDLLPLESDGVDYLCRHAEIAHDERRERDALKRSQAAANVNLYEERHGRRAGESKAGDEVALAHLNRLRTLAVENIGHGARDENAGATSLYRRLIFKKL